jgi:hypothetical protein
MAIFSMRGARVRSVLVTTATVFAIRSIPGWAVAGADTVGAISLNQAVVSGAVLRDGKPVSGATIQTLVWPNTDTLTALADGAPVPTRQLPASKTDGTGRFVVTLADGNLPASYLDAKGRSQIELQVSDGGGRVVWSFTARPKASGWTSVGQQNAGSSAAESVAIDVGATPTVTVLSDSGADGLANGSMSAKDAVAIGTPEATTVLPDVPNPPACQYYGSTWLYNRVEPFAHVYPGSKAPATIYQSYNVDHTVGIALTGAHGWLGGSAGGSRTISLGASGARTLTYNATAFNSLNFRDYKNSCGWTIRQAMSVYAILSRIDAASEPDFTYCGFATSGDYVKHKGNNITFRNDVNVGPVSVDAQSGWSEETDIKWHVTSFTGICGPTAIGWVEGPEAEANSR